MITAERYLDLRRELFARGFGVEYEWCENVQPPVDGWAFFLEYGWVVANSGMRNQVAAAIWERILTSLEAGGTIADAFGHPGKAAALQLIHDERDERHDAYMGAPDKIAFLAELPWIGPITKWHLAKNFGVECAKPDRHLTRLADAEGLSVTDLCSRLAGESGDRIATVDLVLWRAANLGLLNTRAAS